MIGDHQIVSNFMNRLPSIGPIAGGINVFITQIAKGLDQEFAYVDFVIYNQNAFS